MKVFLNNSLLITRPLQESLVFSRHVYNLNHSIRTICVPLFEIEIIEVEKDLNEIEAIELSKKNDRINKNLSNKKIVRTIFVKNKIINYLTN